MKLNLLFPVFYFQGNEYFKQKKFAEAIECYSRSIGLSPTAVAFANRAMAYLKLRRQVIWRLYAFTSAYTIYSFVMLLLQVVHLSRIWNLTLVGITNLRLLNRAYFVYSCYLCYL